MTRYTCNECPAAMRLGGCKFDDPGDSRGGPSAGEPRRCPQIGLALWVPVDDAPAPEEPAITITIPIAYLSWVTFDAEQGCAEIGIDDKTAPAEWDISSVPVDLATAHRAMDLMAARKYVLNSEVNE